jgi:hypothetical protein
VAIYSPGITNTAETLAWQLAFTGHRVTLVTDSSFGREGELATARARMAALKDVALCDVTAAPEPADWIVLTLSRRRRIRSQPLDAWIACARRTALLLEGPYHGWRERAREFLLAQPYCWWAAVVIRQHGGTSRNVYPFIARHRQYAPYIHPHIFCTSSLFENWRQGPAAEAQAGTHRFAFMGNREPAERAAVLDEIAGHFRTAHPELTWTGNPDSPADIFWLAHDRHSPVRGLAAGDYLALLRRATFCLCPAGWGGLWTHRTVESLGCGAIPILPGPEDYALDLRDGMNCIAVHRGRWADAIERAVRLSPAEVTLMRRAIAQLWRERLAPEVAARRQWTTLTGDSS